MDCSHHNGDLLSYLVQYEAQESGDTETHTAIGAQAHVLNLMSSTTYSIAVAAVNSAGTGEFSPPVMIETRPSK